MWASRASMLPPLEYDHPNAGRLFVIGTATQNRCEPPRTREKAAPDPASPDSWWGMPLMCFKIALKEARSFGDSDCLYRDKMPRVGDHGRSHDEESHSCYISRMYLFPAWCSRRGSDGKGMG